MLGNISSISKQNKRNYQEDRYFVINNNKGTFVCVFDGHGGSGVSEFCYNNVWKILQTIKLIDPKEILVELVKELDFQTQQMNEGSTLSIALINDNPLRVTIAILGDSPVVVYTKEGNTNIGPEHNVRSNSKEKAAIESRGGIYEKGYIYTDKGTCGLQLSRALGDFKLDSILSRNPDIYTIENPQWVLVASDGIFDAGHKGNEKIFEEIKELAKNNSSAEEVSNWSDIRNPTDNTTAIVWSL